MTTIVVAAKSLLLLLLIFISVIMFILTTSSSVQSYYYEKLKKLNHLINSVGIKCNIIIFGDYIRISAIPLTLLLVISGIERTIFNISIFNDFQDSVRNNFFTLLILLEAITFIFFYFSKLEINVKIGYVIGFSRYVAYLISFYLLLFLAVSSVVMITDTIGVVYYGSYKEYYFVVFVGIYIFIHSIISSVTPIFSGRSIIKGHIESVLFFIFFASGFYYFGSYVSGFLAAAGYHSAFEWRGQFYLSGTGGSVWDDEKGFQFYKRAADHGLIYASKKLADYCIYNGRPFGRLGVKLNEALSVQDDSKEYAKRMAEYYRFIEDNFNYVKFLKILSESGDSESSLILGRAYLQGNLQLQKDSTLGEKYIRASVESDNLEGNVELVKFIERGLIKRRNNDDIVSLLYLAASNDLSEAQFELGRHYESGIAVKENRTEAIYWYFRAAYSGDNNAVRALANLLESGSSGLAANRNWLSKLKSGSLFEVELADLSKNSNTGSYGLHIEDICEGKK